MKRILLLLTAVGMIFTACQSGGDVEEDNGGAPFVPEITISPKDLTFGCNGGEQEVAITANFEYEVAKRASWLTVEQTDEGLLVVVDENKNTSKRSAFISITNSQYDINKSIEVWQEGFVPKIELAQQSIEVEFEPAEYEVAVTSPYSWEATTKNDWIVIESKTGIAGEEKLKFTTLRNKEEQERKGTITLKNTDYNLVAELYITQKGVPKVILYTSSNGKIVTPYQSNVFGANIVSNTYSNGQGVIIFDAPVTSIGDYAFRYCTSLTSITIPYSVTSIGVAAFSSCGSLTSITIPDSVTEIGPGAFSRCSSLTSVTIPDSVTSIGDDAFGSCTSLKSITISKAVDVISQCTFCGCTSLKSVTIPDSVTSIGVAAFSYCTSLASVTIGYSVTSIGVAAFESCTSLTSVYCKPTTPPVLSSSVFSSNASNRMIYVPKESVAAYREAKGWKDYASKIVGYDFE